MRDQKVEQKSYGICNNSFLVGMPPCPVDIHTHSSLYYTMTTSDIVVANIANETTLECALLWCECLHCTARWRAFNHVYAILARDILRGAVDTVAQ